jgi:hypothetical protein
MPCTVTVSPGRSVSALQPPSSRSIGLSASTAQLSVVPLASRTLTNTCTCGFRQSTRLTTPVSVIGFFESNFAEIA